MAVRGSRACGGDGCGDGNCDCGCNGDRYDDRNFDRGADRDGYGDCNANGYINGDADRDGYADGGARLRVSGIRAAWRAFGHAAD